MDYYLSAATISGQIEALKCLAKSINCTQSKHLSLPMSRPKRSPYLRLFPPTFPPLAKAFHHHFYTPLPIDNTTEPLEHSRHARSNSSIAVRKEKLLLVKARGSSACARQITPQIKDTTPLAHNQVPKRCSRTATDSHSFTSRRGHRIVCSGIIGKLVNKPLSPLSFPSQKSQRTKPIHLLQPPSPGLHTLLISFQSVLSKLVYRATVSFIYNCLARPVNDHEPFVGPFSLIDLYILRQSKDGVPWVRWVR